MCVRVYDMVVGLEGERKSKSTTMDLSLCGLTKQR